MEGKAHVNLAHAEVAHTKDTPPHPSSEAILANNPDDPNRRSYTLYMAIISVVIILCMLCCIFIALYVNEASKNCNNASSKSAASDAERSLLFYRRTTSDYVISKGSQSMSAITACFWVKTYESSGLASFISYAVSDNDNEFTMVDRDGVKVWVKWNSRNRNTTETSSTDIKVNDGVWHPICFTWSSPNGRYKIYKDGKAVAQGVGLSSGKSITGGGTWVLGQDQGVEGGGFNVTHMMQGEITGVNIWDKVLPEEETLEFSTRCQSKNMQGSVKSWRDFISGVKGDVKVLEKPSCWSDLVG